MGMYDTVRSSYDLGPGWLNKDLQTKDPKRAGFLSMFLLWNHSSLQKSIRDYNRRLKDGNFSLPLV